VLGEPCHPVPYQITFIGHTPIGTASAGQWRHQAMLLHSQCSEIAMLTRSFACFQILLAAMIATRFIQTNVDGLLVDGQLFDPRCDQSTSGSARRPTATAPRAAKRRHKLLVSLPTETIARPSNQGDPTCSVMCFRIESFSASSFARNSARSKLGAEACR